MNNNPQDVRFPASRYPLFGSVFLVGLVADLVSKSIVFAKFYRPGQRLDPHVAQQWWIGELFGVQTSTNGGALFGIGQGMHLLFAGLSLIALIGILVWLFVYKAAALKFYTVSLGAISAGICGNLYDRLGFGFTHGHPDAIRYHVRDWIYFRWQGVPLFDPWPNFNIADSLLVVGATSLFVHSLFFYEKKNDH